MPSSVTGAILVAPPSPLLHSHKPGRRFNYSTSKLRPVSAALTTRPSVISPLDGQGRPSPSGSNTDSVTRRRDDSNTYSDSEAPRLSLVDYFEVSKQLVLTTDGGPPRWFTPLVCGSASRLKDSPLLLFLPGIDGVGTGLLLQCPSLGEIFDIWCLHIPLSDRSPFTDLVKLVEETIRSENSNRPKSPIYLVGESVGGCLALAVAARNPDMHLVLILANPATCFNKSQLQLLLPLLEVMPEQVHPSLLHMLSLMSGIPSRMAMNTVQNGLPLQRKVGELSQGALALSSYNSVLSDALSEQTLRWKLKMLKSAASFTNSRLHAVKARTLILSSGQDQLLPSREEGERLCRMLPNCEIRMFNNSSHALFLEDGFDLVRVIKSARFYQRGRCLDYVFDYLPPKPSEFKKTYEPFRWIDAATSPVMLSTLENGKIVRGLSGIPSEGPALFVGYHMMLGLELVPLVSRIWIERKILLRGIAHPLMFRRIKGAGLLPDLSAYDAFKFMGAVPVSAINFYKLCSSKSHILLYPGGMREALHRKGEEYKLIWPEQSEFVRMAARFGAKIIPFGAVGEDDVGQLLLDYDDLVKLPYFKSRIQQLTDETVKLRSDIEGEVANQDVHLPIILPKLPGRFYFLFGKPIETKARKQELQSREKAHELYLEIKSEVASCINYIKEKRVNDPYRNILARLGFQARHGFDCEVPTFEL